jgi:glycine cleavage system regulatory protein
MPVTNEFTVLTEDRPNALGKVCRALAEHGVNILALQSFPNRREDRDPIHRRQSDNSQNGAEKGEPSTTSMVVESVLRVCKEVDVTCSVEQ